jgi:stage II sporulation protein P
VRRIAGMLFLIVYLGSTVFFYDGKNLDLEVNAADFGVMCISAAYPGLNLELETNMKPEPENEQKAEIVTADIETEKKTQPEMVVSGSDEPQVLIVHTHATESYLPASEGNYHTKEAENSVRDVGNVLAETLKAEGIAAVHDQTLHDSPSYNQSYSRSYTTITEMLKKYPTIKCVIDLHRDAIASDSPAATVSVSGKTCARYSYVVSNAVPTYSDNLTFINAMNETASEEYSGFTGKILERGYRYNQDLSSKYMLLEIGYNRNRIEDARNTAEVFAKILADTLKAGH